VPAESCIKLNESMRDRRFRARKYLRLPSTENGILKVVMRFAVLGLTVRLDSLWHVAPAINTKRPSPEE